MIALNIHLDGDGIWPDLAKKGFQRATALSVAGLEGGMESGNPSVTIRVDLPDGRVVVAETSLKLFLTAADALRGRYGDPRL